MAENSLWNFSGAYPSYNTPHPCLDLLMIAVLVTLLLRYKIY
jgi:hypothetical protein